ncbi:unnamed protein product [Jaminaea pallidilutea]
MFRASTASLLRTASRAVAVVEGSLVRPSIAPRTLPPASTFSSFAPLRQANDRNGSAPSSASSSSQAPASDKPAQPSRQGDWSNLWDLMEKPEPSSSSSPSSSTGSPARSQRFAGGNPDAGLSIEERQERAWSTRTPCNGGPFTPRSGRMVYHNANRTTDLSYTYGRLRRILMNNKVMLELRRGSRYEKPNQMRKRKASEAHRRRFADMIRQKVKLVMDLKNRGG